jgi:chromosome partitioning protein
LRTFFIRRKHEYAGMPDRPQGRRRGRGLSRRRGFHFLREGFMEKETHGTIIAVGNQKGGVGKTSNCVHIAAALGQRGYRSLVMDLDPAAGATKHLGIPVKSFSGTLELLTTDESIENLAITDAMPTGVHLIPSRPQLNEIDNLCSKYLDRTRILERPIAEARTRYDFIFLDTGPSAAFTTTVAAYSSADWFLLSAFPHPLSLGGLTEAFNDIADVRKHRNPSLEVLGVVFTNVDGRATRLRAQLEAVVSQALPGRQFRDSISQAVIVPEVSGKGITLFQIPRYHAIPVAQQYLRLSIELEHRVNNREAFLNGELGPVDYSALQLLGGAESDNDSPIAANE